jgi:DNA repair photolyase
MDRPVTEKAAQKASLPQKGRGARSNADGRFETERHELCDDGWGSADEPAPVLRTTVIRDSTRTVIARNQSPDIPFDRSINPYRGCEHGCTYCFARPTHAYLGLSPGLDFESKILIKPEAAKLLEAELRAPSYRCRHLAMGTNTDPYQPLEKELRITRSVLEVLAAFRHPVSIVTKSHLVTRDIDILAPMAKAGLALVCVSVTTLDRKLARAMEPRAATPERRLEALHALSQAGIPTMAMAAPIIPGLNDHEIEDIAAAAADHGAMGLSHVLLRMPLEIKDLFREWLETDFPDRAKRVLTLLRDMRGGKDYDSRWFERQKGSGPFAQLISDRVEKARRRHGLDRPLPPLDVKQFRAPPLPPKPGEQLRLL